MRTQFIQTLLELAERDDRIWLVAGDLGYSVLEKFSDRFPGRYLNAGVAEQNMTGIAAGLALSGKIAFTYSIANFPVFRCLEQVRNDVAYHDLDVKIVAVGGGLAYGSAGYTHHAVEDLAVMRALPNMVVLAPGDPVETDHATRAIAAHRGPCYLRLGKAGEPLVHAKPPAFEIGKGIVLREGRDGVVISTGGMLTSAMAVADSLRSRGRDVGVVSMHTIQPIDRALITDLAGRVRAIMTLEEHGVGGLGSAVAEVLAELDARPRFRAMRLEGPPITLAGTQVDLRERSGLSVASMVKAIERLLA